MGLTIPVVIDPGVFRDGAISSGGPNARSPRAPTDRSGAARSRGSHAQQFEHDADSWDKATLLEDVLKKLKSLFTSQK